MKRIITIFLLAVAIPVMAKPASIPGGKDDVKVTVSWKFLNLVEGYDHDSKCEIYIDGNLVATSSVSKESKPNSVSFNVSKGSHTIKVVNYAYYEGTWEEHTIANNYSIDCLYENRMTFNKRKNKLPLVFDIDKGTSLAK